jgi:hypothetical protein
MHYGCCRNLQYWATAGIFTLISACGGGGGGGNNVTEADSTDTLSQTSRILSSVSLPVEDIMAAIYLNKRVPDDFYRENDPDPNTFESIRHIRNIDIAAQPANTPVYELCADNFGEALQWSEDAGNILGDLVDTAEANLFFEFVRVPSSRPEFRNIQRVYKCEVLDRSLVDTNEPDEHMGFYNQTPQTALQVKEILEYLWTFSFLNNYGNAVLTSQTLENPQEFLHTLHQARLQTGMNGECDLIEVYATVYTVDKNTGNITFVENKIDEFEATFNGFAASLCE